MKQFPFRSGQRVAGSQKTLPHSSGCQLSFVHRRIYVYDINQTPGPNLDLGISNNLQQVTLMCKFTSYINEWSWSQIPLKYLDEDHNRLFAVAIQLCIKTCLTNFFQDLFSYMVNTISLKPLYLRLVIIQYISQHNQHIHNDQSHIS